MKHLRLLALLLVFWPWLACAGPVCALPEGEADGGMGGTGIVGAPQQAGGMGGTGAPLASGGIGGTGAPQQEGGMGGTGIVGTITGFASVCVNGLEVHFDPATPVSDNGRPAGVASLAIGQVVAIHALPSARGWVARSIDILNLLEGPITRVSGDAGRIEVMGRPVRSDAATRLAGLASLEAAAPGALLKVSGYRDGAGVVLATRIEAVRELPEASVIGFASRAGTGAQEISGLPVQSATALPLPPGGEMLARGVWEDGRLRITDRRSDPSLPFAGQVAHLVVEGVAMAHPAGHGLRLGGFDLEVAPDSAAMGQRVIVTGRLEADGDARRLQAIRFQRVFHAGRDRPVSGRPGQAAMKPPERIQRPMSMTRPERPMRVMPRSAP